MPSFPEPTWGTPEDANFESVFAKREATPFEVKAATLRLLQYHYSDSNNIDTPLLKNLVWTPDETTTALRIEVLNSEDDLEALRHPAIYVMRDDIQATNMGELRGLRIVPSPNNPPATHEQYVRHATSKIILLCQHPSAETAEALATETFMRLMRFSPVITADLHLDRYDVDGIGKVQKRPETQIYFATVVASWHKTYEWLIFREEPY